MTGGCLCGRVRFEAAGKPARTLACHCTFCQRCTGSAFALWPTYPQADVTIAGTLAVYEHHSDESGRWIRMHFCPRCGTSVASTWEADPGEIALLGGTFDDTRWLTVDRHVWTRSKQHWFALPPGAAAFERSSRQ